MKVPHRTLDMCSSDFENSHVFCCACRYIFQDDVLLKTLLQVLPCTCIPQIFYCKSCKQVNLQLWNINANLKVHTDAYFHVAHTLNCFTYLLSGVVCFISWCGWLSTAIQVCKGHKRVQEPKYILVCWEFKTSPSSKFSSLIAFLPPQRATMRWKKWRPFDVMSRKKSPNWWESQTGQTVVSWDFCLLCFSAKECVFNAWRRGDIPCACRQRTSLSPLPPTLYPASVHPGIQANKM